MQTGQQQALGRLYAMAQARAAAISYIDMYWLLAVACAAMFLATFQL
jgi:hypothetical protein